MNQQQEARPRYSSRVADATSPLRTPPSVLFDEVVRKLCLPSARWPAGVSAGEHWGTTGAPSAGAVAEAGCTLDLVREFTSPSCLGGGASASSLPPAAAYGRSAARPYPAGRAGAIIESRRSDQLQPRLPGTYNYSGTAGRGTTHSTYYSSYPIVRPSIFVASGKNTLFALRSLIIPTYG
jgi:hypothetical protein